MNYTLKEGHPSGAIHPMATSEPTIFPLEDKPIANQPFVLTSALKLIIRSESLRFHLMR